jgi:hypothetical protein
MAVSFGFQIEVEVSANAGDLHYPYRFSKDTEIWLGEFREKVHKWLSQAPEHSTLCLPAPVPGLEVRISLVARLDHQGVRSISFSLATRSSDSRLSFEVGTADDTARSEWGRRLKSKLAKEQCGSPSGEILRMLIVNFALADTVSPDFICRTSFAKRFEATVHCLVGTESPYDILIPARLGLTSWFGEAVVLGLGLATRGRGFIQQAGLDQRCTKAVR